MYLRILYKIHVFRFMSQHLCISRILCKIHVNVSGFMSQHLYISGSSARSMSRFMSQHLCISGFFYKIHVFGFMSQHPLIWILYKIHVFGLMSQHLCISGSSARSMSPDPYISIHMYLRILCKIHVSGSVYKSMSSDTCLSIFESQDPLQDPCVRFMS